MHIRMVAANLPGVHFVGEQRGETEQEFIARIFPVLLDDETVQRSYLARVIYQIAPERIALCIRGGKSQSELARKLGSTFSEMFSRSQKLDILFLDAAQETDLAKVCKPFFRRAAK